MPGQPKMEKPAASEHADALSRGASAEIVDASCARYRIPLERPVLGASARAGVTPSALTHWDLVVVEVRTSTGETGSGFTYELRAGGGAVEVALREDILPLVVGADCHRPEQLWERLYWATYNVGRRGAYIHALAAVDTAVWDARARSLDLPLATLLGAERSSVPLYESDSGWLSLSLDELVRRNVAAIENGFNGTKIFVGGGDLADDVKRVGAVRKAIGATVPLMVDAGQKWTMPEAIERVRRLEDFELYWVEEPLPCDDVRGHEQLASSIQARIATGQTLTTRYEFEPLLENGAVQVIQPDVARLGGVTEWLRLTGSARAAGIEVAPHFLMELHVSLVAATPTGTFVERTPWLSPLLSQPPILQEGSLLVPSAPGHGLRLHRECEAFRLS